MINSVATGSIWQNVLKFLKKRVQKIQKSISQVNSDTLQFIQLSVMYFFALIDLLHSILNNVFSLGSIPQFIQPLYPYVKMILQSPIFKIWGSPEKVFFMSYILIELVLVRNVVNFSKLVKYNMLLIFACLMMQGLVISYWDLLFHREISTSVASWAYDGGTMIHTDKGIGSFFFFLTFLLFSSSYLYLYIRSLQGEFGSIPGMTWLSDSVAFWLRIKTPTMRTGIRKNKK